VNRMIESPIRIAVRLLTFLLLVSLLLTPLAAADSNTDSADAAKESLDRILAGAAPVGVADLKAMQDHVRKLTDQLMKCTVGVQVGQAQGSGVIISKDGYVLTAAHVAHRPNRDVNFILWDGREMKGKTLGLNRTLDAGLMKISGADNLAFAEMGDSASVKLGQWCLATGHPGGYQSDRKPVLRLGRVQWTADEAITTDCTLVGGDSGGPLFDMQGKVVGINSRIGSELQANMHVPVGTFKDTWERLNKGEAWGFYPGNKPVLGVERDPAATNARIAVVRAGSPAEKSGLKAGDVVLKVDGLEVSDFDALSNAVKEHQPRDTIKLVIQRGEETLEKSVQLARQ
jgi:serine protease Do